MSRSDEDGGSMWIIVHGVSGPTQMGSPLSLCGDVFVMEHGVPG
jgi:hypothetical protein